MAISPSGMDYFATRAEDVVVLDTEGRSVDVYKRQFVERMNERAAELGLENTQFTNCTGLVDDTAHYTCALDIASMSRELLSHEWIKDYTTIWMDSVRDGASELTNTNRLVRYYEGCTGLKTGYTLSLIHI